MDNCDFCKVEMRVTKVEKTPHGVDTWLKCPKCGRKGIDCKPTSPPFDYWPFGYPLPVEEDGA